MTVWLSHEELCGIAKGLVCDSCERLCDAAKGPAWRASWRGHLKWCVAVPLHVWCNSGASLAAQFGINMLFQKSQKLLFLKPLFGALPKIWDWIRKYVVKGHGFPFLQELINNHSKFSDNWLYSACFIDYGKHVGLLVMQMCSIWHYDH